MLRNLGPSSAMNDWINGSVCNAESSRKFATADAFRMKLPNVSHLLFREFDIKRACYAQYVNTVADISRLRNVLKVVYRIVGFYAVLVIRLHARLLCAQECGRYEIVNFDRLRSTVFTEMHGTISQSIPQLQDAIALLEHSANRALVADFIEPFIAADFSPCFWHRASLRRTVTLG